MDTSAQLAKWRHLIEPELLRCATPLRWVDLLSMPVTVYERESSVLVTHDALIGGSLARTVLVACGVLSEIAAMLNEVEGRTRADSIDRVMFVGRRGWLRALQGYREIAVICEKVV